MLTTRPRILYDFPSSGHGGTHLIQDADKKKRLWPLVIVVLGVGYLLVAVRPLGVERGFQPRWVVAVQGESPAEASPPPSREAPSAVAESDLVAFRFKDRFGYLSPDGSVVLSRLYVQDIALGDSPPFSAWAEFQPGKGSSVFSSPSGARLFSLPSPESPFFLGGRLFSIAADDAGISAWSESGKKVWSRDLPSVLTALSAGSQELAVGCLDGNAEVIGPDGQALFSFKPGGSRVSIILGLAISPDGDRLAMVAGLEPQRFLLFERRHGSYKLKRHFDLASDFRRRVALSFSTDGRMLFLEQAGRLDVIRADGGAPASLPLPGQILALHPGTSKGLHLVYCRSGSDGKAMVFSSSGKLVMSADLPEGCELLARREDALYLGSAGRVARLDMVESGR